MKKIVALFLFFSVLGLKAQYGSINAILDELEERRGVNKNLKNVSIDNVKFVLIKEFDDHTERNFIVIKGKQATYVEVFDDKQTGQSTSNVFSGDIVRSKNEIISLRADKLEGKKIPIALTKTFLMTKQKKILYLIDINTQERWIEEGSINKK
ncbi:hypothetical protein [Kaistella antarctica]|uniref:Beta-lactamase-inhibitor-like PepSY-like domain-containing protein n=1 Tax=Kaistella antarctica TaxID=266748 RepID=A0A448NR18_9FLAO|nr:hypothetical protein [Kaistella antarctica]KEY18909.1 hypothetical protein HY04_10635 [Kaistella antarctica]SEW13972.1 hypothetical protein SAMN05421765_2607 [Kaistella antarctica]VEH99241.1 Uncharacterised protein [Kaistella antarctica]